MPYTVDFKFADGEAQVINVEELSFTEDIITMKGERTVSTVRGVASLFMDTEEGCYVSNPTKVEHCEVTWEEPHG